MKCKYCDLEKGDLDFRRPKVCKICFAKRYYKYPLTGTKSDRVSKAYGKPICELLSEMRINRNMKVLDICKELGISKRTYLRYMPREIIGEKRILTDDDIRQKQYWAEQARKAWQAKPRKIKKDDPEKGLFSWRKTNSKFFEKRPKGSYLHSRRKKTGEVYG